MTRHLTTRDTTPLPPISTGTTGTNHKVLVPKDAPNANSISRSVSSGTVTFRPNNYRRKILCHELDHGAISAIQKRYTSVSIGTHNKLVFVRDYDRVSIQVGRRWITGIWRQKIVNGVKESFTLPSAGIAVKVEEIRKEIDRVLADFCERIGVLGESVPMWDWHEDGLSGERFIDSLPRDLVLQTDVFTKLYDEGIEFKGKEYPGVHAEQYIRNRAIEDIAPQIAAELERIRRAVMRSQPLLAVKDHVRVFPSDLVGDEVRVLVEGMTEREREALSEWTFTKFGGGER